MSRGVTTRPALLAMVLAASLSCGAPPEPPACAGGPVTSALIGGTDVARFLGLDERQASAVVQVVSRDPAGAEHACTGTVVAPSWVLSAAHCTPAAAEATEVRLTDAASVVRAAAPVDRVVVHPWLDLILLHAEGNALEGAPAIPIAGSLPADFDGRLLQLGGTGYTETGALGPRLFSVAAVVAVAAEAFTVSADGYAGLCGGDSGGPALLRADDGAPSIAGVLAAGSASCRGSDDFVRIDLARDWVHAAVGPPPPGDSGCGTLDAAGQCFGGLAVWCAGGALRAERCGGDRRCGWDTGSQGHRCIQPAADACGGVDTFGICRDGDAVHCVAGRLRRNTCRRCGALCARSPRSGIVTCAPADAAAATPRP